MGSDTCSEKRNKFEEFNFENIMVVNNKLSGTAILSFEYLLHNKNYI